MKVHIGAEIEKRFDESGMKVSVFAKKISTTPRNIYNLFKKESLPLDRLILIGEVLGYDFIKLYTKSEYTVNEIGPTVVNEGLPKKEDIQLSVMINLDGSPETLKQWIERLTQVNKALNTAI